MRLPILLTCLALPAVAEDAEPIVATTTPGSVAIALRVEGYRAKITQDDDIPVIESGVGGTRFTVRFYGCDDGANCQAMMFVASFDTDNGVTLARVNDWNREEVFGRAYLDENCDPYFEHIAVADPEVDHAVFVETLDHWDFYVHEFRRFIGFDDENRSDFGTVTCGGSETL